MSAYTEHEGFAIVVGGIRYRLVDALVWHIGHVDGPTYTVPAGFVFDVSVPRGLWWLFDPHRPQFHKAAALHDHMLESAWSRITAAAEFHEALKADDVPLWRRLMMFLAVAFYRYV